ncbi:LysR family transcriptional regulator [Cupriavidus sp. M-11]|uniref:LysR family transcriptional regulator n=1 Tax=Cupriavidus sp. M-11 TaxID=3233038 RepID=UPI003F92EF47
MADEFDWTLMRSFLAVMECGSLLGAARRLASSQPTLGRHVAQLEAQLGVPLFERTGHGLRPTDAARAIAGHARAMQEGADAVARALAGSDAGIAGTIRVSASRVVASYLLPPLLADLRLREPQLAIEVVSSNEVSNLLRREADIAIRMVRPSQASLIARKVASLALCACAHEDYLRRKGVPRTARDLLRHELIGYDRDDTIVRGLRGTGLEITRDAFSVRSDDDIVLWQSIRAGLGVGFAARYLVAGDARVRTVLPALPIPPLPVWLTVHREIRGSARIRTVYDFLASAIPAAVAAS